MNKCEDLERTLLKKFDNETARLLIIGVRYDKSIFNYVKAKIKEQKNLVIISLSLLLPVTLIDLIFFHNLTIKIFLLFTCIIKCVIYYMLEFDCKLIARHIKTDILNEILKEKLLSKSEKNCKED